MRLCSQYTVIILNNLCFIYSLSIRLYDHPEYSQQSNQRHFVEKV
jgi:hypothetical protein